MRLVIVGGVAGGATAAARARRLNEDAEIIVFERGEYISYANCGLPYYIGGFIKSQDDLLVATPELFWDRYRIEVRLKSEVTAIDPKKKTVCARSLAAGTEEIVTYDKLILSPGAAPVRPPIPGISDVKNIFYLRTVPDSEQIRRIVEQTRATSALVVGGGFIGLEMAENLAHKGLATTLVERLHQVMPPFDPEMAIILSEHLEEKGIDVILGDGVASFAQEGEKTVATTESGKKFEADLVIMAIGVRPEVELAREAGLEIGGLGGIKVHDTMQTSDPDIYAVGDAVEVMDMVTGLPALIPLAGPANRQARIAADNAMGRRSLYRGTLGTSIVKVFDLTAAVTGANEKTLKRAGIPYRVSYTHSPSHATYYPGAIMMAIKLLFAPGSSRILGAQIVGGQGVDKRIDVIATAIMGQMNVHDLEFLELAYAPPFGSAKDAVNIAGYVASNILKRDVESVDWRALHLEKLDPEKSVVIDVREKRELDEFGRIEGALHIPLNSLRDRLPSLDPDKEYIIACAIGLRGYIAYRIMVQNGFKAKKLSGGYTTYKMAAKVPPEAFEQS